jgi:hypothetical protein
MDAAMGCVMDLLSELPKRIKHGSSQPEIYEHSARNDEGRLPKQ